MVDTVSRTNAAETRARILDATWKLVNSDPQGDRPRTRMADIAKEAAVSRQAIYLHFPSRADLLIATMRHIDEVENVADQLAAVFNEKTGRGQLTAFLDAWCNYIPVIYGGARWLLAIRDEDPDAEAAWQDRMAGLYGACSSVVDALHADKELASNLSRAEAVDVLWSMVSVRQWELLTIERGMSQTRYIEIVQHTLERTLLG